MKRIAYPVFARNKPKIRPGSLLWKYLVEGRLISGGAIAGTATSFDQLTGKKLDFEDTVNILTPMELPLLGTFNGTTNLPPGQSYNSILAMGPPAIAKKIEWQEEELKPARSTLNGAITNVAVSIVLPAGHGIRFMIGHVALLDTGEKARVTGVDLATDTLTVTRAFAGTAAAAQGNGTDIVAVGTALAEGSDPGNARFKDRDPFHNLMQIFGPYAVDISGTQEAIANAGGIYGVRSETEKQLTNGTREVWLEYEHALMYGTRFNSDNDKWRTMGGYIFYVTGDSVDSTTTELDYSAVRARMQESYKHGGVIDTILAPPAQILKVDDFNAAQVRIGQTEGVRGAVVNRILTHFGFADIVMSRHLRDKDTFLFDRQWWDLSKLRPLTVEPLGKTGDHHEMQLVCEKSCRIKFAKRHQRFDALAA